MRGDVQTHVERLAGVVTAVTRAVTRKSATHIMSSKLELVQRTDAHMQLLVRHDIGTILSVLVIFGIEVAYRPPELRDYAL